MNNTYLLFNCKDCGYAAVLNGRTSDGKRCPECGSGLFIPIKKALKSEYKTPDFIPPPTNGYQPKTKISTDPPMPNVKPIKRSMQAISKFLPYCSKCKDLDVVAGVSRMYAEGKINCTSIFVQCNDYDKCSTFYENIKESILCDVEMEV